ncbi:MAG TPA: glycoside hydrolase family 3 protein [Clostridiaceae bacterium]|nr:glycoside hydrolase family 3 protein [Clostridiaceae bacterium]
MRKVMALILILLLGFSFPGCNKNNDVVEVGPKPSDSGEPASLISIAGLSDEEIISRMSLSRKAAQMVQAERYAITPLQAVSYGIGSVLSGGGSSPRTNSPEAWLAMYNEYQSQFVSKEQIPILYGVDAVHGHNNVYGATVFPHNIGLGAARDPELMSQIGQAVAKEVAATGIDWNFAPAVSVVQDIRWGRTYESFGESAELQRLLVAPYVKAFQENGIIATAKHFIADGGTDWNDNRSYKIDQGNAALSDEELREIHLPGYIEAINAGVDAIMVSFSSLNGRKMHGNKELITDFLKDELGFQGIVISDWEALHQLPGSFEDQVVACVNAGVDMLMEPNMWKETIDAIVKGVEKGRISMDRVDDAVRRILRVKRKYNILDNPVAEGNEQDFYNEAHRELARRAVRETLVLLKNENGILPLKKNADILLIGPGINNIGYQCGGWTIEWQGSNKSDLVPGTTIQEAFEAVAAENGGRIITDLTKADEADAVVLVIGEAPYAEGIGDNGSLTLDSNTAMEGNLEAVRLARETGLPIVTVMLAGRPMIITEEIQDWAGFVMAWLPGSEGGAGIADCIFGDFDFKGKLPVTWPRSADQFGYNVNYKDYDPQKVLFPYGFGLSYSDN